MTRGKRKNAELLVEYLQQMLFPWREILAGLRGNGTLGLGTRRSVSLVRGRLVLTTQATGPSGTRGHEHKAHTAKWEIRALSEKLTDAGTSLTDAGTLNL